MKDKLIKAMAIEYDAVYLVDLENDTYETIKLLNGSPAMVSTTCWSDAGKAFSKECSDDSREILNLFSDPQFLKTTLAEKDNHECTFRHVVSDSKWRKCCVHIVERKNSIPKLVLVTVSTIDKLSYQKEKILQKIMSVNSNTSGQISELNNELSIYKKILSNEAEEDDHKLFTGIRILLVEDNEILRLISKETLENEGAIVTEAENGRIAVDTITSGNRFDFIIMDIIMPVLDGVQATKEITEYQKEIGIKTPILGLTADATEDQMKTIIDAGAYACLSKPLNLQEMSKVFISCMKEKSILMEEQMAEINLLANTDMLTQTGNIVAYTRDIGELSKDLYDNKYSVAIVVCDLDNLKGINDTYGHDVGDIYIKNCCSMISNAFKNSPLYRVGGDEFALIVKGTDLEIIDDIMVGLNNKSRKLSEIKDVVNGRASVSAGYALYEPSVDQSISDTMKRADMAMYENKLLHKKWTDTYGKLGIR